MWIAFFINQYGTAFTTREDELTGITMMEYIAYCTERHSILVDLKRE